MKRGLLCAVVLALLALMPAMSEAGEAEDRKARSVAVLQAEEVPFIDWLPVIETEAETTRRSEEEVARRTIALAIVAVRGETRDYALGQSLLNQFGAHDFLSPAEAAFMADEDPSEQDYINFIWRYEGVHVLLWALGIFEDLGRPDGIADVPRIAATLRDLGTDGLIEQARLRPQSELLDAADLIYRYHWATVDARLNGRDAPAGLDPSVVYERHYALNWLIGYGGQAWDDISTDT